MYVDVHRPPVSAAEAVRDLRSDVREPGLHVKNGLKIQTPTPKKKENQKIYLYAVVF